MSVAWAAGLFEGEGYVTAALDNNRGRRYLRIGIEMADLDVLERFRDVVKVGTITPRKTRRNTNRQMFVWRCGEKDFFMVSRILWEDLSNRRRDQIASALEKRSLSVGR